MERPAIPWRTIWATIACVVLTAGALRIIMLLSRVLLWMAIAALLATILSPAANLTQRRLHVRRGIAVALVMLASTAVVSTAAFVVIGPLVTQDTSYSDQVQNFLQDARAGKGTAGNLVKKFKLQERFSEKNIQKFGKTLASGSWSVAQRVGNALVALITILTLMILMLAKGPQTLSATARLFPENQQVRLSNIGAQCARAVSGYMIGNLLISLVAGTFNFAFLTIAGVPFAGVLAVWVAVSDLIPLIGATLGAIAVVLVAFIDSPTKGIAAIVFCLLYQLFENNVLSVAVMSRTVHLDPLTVLVSMLIGVELLGIVGAFVAIPVAGMLQVVVRDIWHHRRSAVNGSSA